MSRDETNSSPASPYAALRKSEREPSAYSKNAKVQPASKGRVRSKLNTKIYHKNQKLATSRINNIVKVKFVKSGKDSTRHIIQHITYLEKRERKADEPERKFTDREGKIRTRDEVIKTMLDSRGQSSAMFKIILSPKQNELDHEKYTREIMERWEEAHGIKTKWHMIQHKNTEHHHVHILMPGVDVDGRSFRLERDHLESLRQIANEHQYELQDIDHQYEKDVEREFGYEKEELAVLRESQRDALVAKDLGIYQPDLDETFREILQRPTDFDPVHFSQELQKEIWKNLSQHGPLIGETLKAIERGDSKYVGNELYAGFVKEIQESKISDVYLARLKGFYPTEYRDILGNPEKEIPVINQMKLAFPEWHQEIVDQLKMRQPELFANYQKSSPKDREISDALMQSDPGLFPEISRKIQENSLDLLTLALVKQTDEALFTKIMNEPDTSRQKEILAQARYRFPVVLDQAQEELAAKDPDVYRWKFQKHTNTDRLVQLLKNNPELFPEAVDQLKRIEMDKWLLQEFYKEKPESLDKVKDNPQQQRQMANYIRGSNPELVIEATDELRKSMPHLFVGERPTFTEADMMRFIIEENTELFPEIMRGIRDRFIDHSYFKRGEDAMPDGLAPYVNDPDLNRTPILKVLKANFKGWAHGIKQEMRDRMPELLKYEPKPKMDEAMRSLYKANVFKSLRKTDKVEPASRLERLEAVRDRLIDNGYFQMGRDKLPDGLTAYWGNSDLDRSLITNGLRNAFPEWRAEIEVVLRKTFKELYRQISKETKIEHKQDREQQQEIAQKQREERKAEFEARERKLTNRKLFPPKITEPSKDAEPTKEAPHQVPLLGYNREPSETDNPAELVPAESTDADKERPDGKELEKDSPEVVKETGEKEAGEKEKDEPTMTREQQLRKEQLADQVRLDAKKFEIPMNWSGLTGIHGSDRSSLPDMEQNNAELRALNATTQRLAQEYKELIDMQVDNDPTLFKLEDSIRDGADEEKEHEQEKDSGLER